MRKIYSIPLLIITLLLIASIIIGTSYSIWIKTNNQKDENVVTTSCFSSTFTEESTINLKNAMPISDTSGLKKTPYTFTLKNNCDVNLKINISLDVLNTSTMSSNSIKVALKSSNIFMTNATLLTNLSKKTTPDIKNAKEAYTLGEDFLGKNATKTYSIWAWMDENVGNEEQGKIFNSKIVVTNTAIDAELLTDKITELSATDTTSFATNDPDNNIRYIGANPNNYVYFNCSDYNNQSDSTCEKWRIIGVFKNITDSNNSKANLVKIIRDSTIGGYSYDSSDSNENNGLGYNDWASADLMKLLNGGYSSLSANNSLYYNASKGACYNSSNNTTTDCDFTTTGLKNDTTRNAFESVIWNIGGIPNDASSTATATKWYQYERGTTVFSSNHSTWTGQIAIMYPSDYGYATSGSILVDRNTCLDYEYTWNSDSYADCRLNNYLYKNLNQSSLGVSSSSNNYFYGIGFSGIARGAIAKNADSVRPTGYLKANTKVYDNVGDGSSNNPYRLILS